MVGILILLITFCCAKVCEEANFIWSKTETSLDLAKKLCGEKGGKLPTIISLIHN
jgi:hypothetical protein